MSNSRSKKDSTPKLDRRKFLAAAAVAGAGSAVKPADAAPSTAVQAPPRVPSALPPNEHVAAAETDVPNIAPYKTEGRPGSDFMVDVIKSLDIKYLPSNPASSYRAIHESLIDYGKNTMPEFLTCTHEEVGVGIAHGYYKIAQKPLMTLCHGTVGLMHATHEHLQRVLRSRCRSSSSPATISTRHTGRLACRPSIRRRISTRSSATTPNGTIRRSRRNISPSRSSAPIRSRPLRPARRSCSRSMTDWRRSRSETTARRSTFRNSCPPRRRPASKAPCVRRHACSSTPNTR